ncbi:MAG: hypothetical protein ACREU0_09490, partial [Burkholderiales bacterium]
MEAIPVTNNYAMRMGAPDSVSRSVEREGAHAAARNIVKWGARAAAPQASLTVSRQPRPFGLRQNAASASCSPERGASGRATVEASTGLCKQVQAGELWPAPLHSFA